MLSKPKFQDLLKNLTTVPLSQDLSTRLPKMQCRDNCKLCIDSCVFEPTGIKTWRQQFPNSFAHWRKNFTKIFQITKGNKLRQFLFKLLYSMIVTNRELKTLNITTDDKSALCTNNETRGSVCKETVSGAASVGM